MQADAGANAGPDAGADAGGGSKSRFADPEKAREAARKRWNKAEAADDLDPEVILENMAKTAKSEHVRADAAKALLAIRAKREAQPGIGEDAITAARQQLLASLTAEERDTVAGALQAALDRNSPPPESAADRLAYLEQRKQRLWEEYSGVSSEIKRLDTT
jgi:hypothetical protein